MFRLAVSSRLCGDARGRRRSWGGPRRRAQGRLGLALCCLVLGSVLGERVGRCDPDPAAIDPDTQPRPLTVALAVGVGMTFDGRACTLAGGASAEPDTQPCVLFTAGGDVALLWRGRIGGALGLYSVSGQAVRTGQDPAIPDRISIPLSLDLRPLSFLGVRGYAGRALAGLGLRLGPSLEMNRTASDQALGLGFYASLFGEIPLSSAARGGVALRVSLHVTAAPLLALNGGVVRSGAFDVCAPSNPDPGCIPGSERAHGYGAVVQTLFGLVYYP